jgi:hypothetical protein
MENPNSMLLENPPAAHHEVLLKQFATIGIGQAWMWSSNQKS